MTIEKMSEANRKAEIARIQKLIDDAKNKAKQNKQSYDTLQAGLKNIKNLAKEAIEEALGEAQLGNNVKQEVFDAITRIETEIINTIDPNPELGDIQ